MNLFLFLAPFFLILPGLAWIAWFPRNDQDLAERLADAIGLSLAIVALVGLGTFLLGFRIPGGALLIVYLIIGGSVFVAAIRRWREIRHGFKLSAIQLLPLFLFFLILGWRFYQARDLVLPAWVDSLHHTMIVRLITQAKMVPRTLEPYIPAPLFYHFGFHVNTALFGFFAQLSPERAVLVMGQILNAVVALGIYRLGMALWRDWRRACIGMVLVGFVTQMPAYYVTWGRYTLLTGIILLLLAMALAIDIVREGASNPRIFQLAVLTGGVLLTHYFAAILLAAFFVLLAVERVFFGSVSLRGLLKSDRMRGVFWGSALGALMALPWVWHVWKHASTYINVRGVAPGQTLDELYFSDYLPYLWYLLGPRRGHVVLVLALISLFLIGWRGKTRPFAVWTLALIAISLPWGMRISPFRPDHGVIVAFLPVSVLVADALLYVLQRPLKPWFRKLSRLTVVTVLMGLVFWGLQETREIINPVTVLATKADLEAIAWIGQHTPEDATFFINLVPWQGNIYRGVDGGWWIPLLSGRKTILPPALYGYGEAEYFLRVNDLSRRAADIQGCTDAFWELVMSGGITHVYLHSDRGSLQPNALVDCPGIIPVYEKDPVYIYEVATNK